MDNIDTTHKDDNRSIISLISNSSSHKRRAIIDLSSLESFTYDNDGVFDVSNVSRAVIEASSVN